MSTQNADKPDSRPPGRRPPAASRAGRAAKPSAGTVRQRQAERQALLESRRARKGRNRRLWTVLAPVAVAVLAVAVLVVVKLASAGGNSGKLAEAADPAVVAKVTGVPAAVFDAVGAGKPYALPTRIDAPITADGKPRVLYIGAEYCPFCAVERWPVIVALSRFGTWHGLRYAYSAAAPEVYPNTATFTFHGASYTSDYISFTGVETHTNKPSGDGYQTLEPLSSADLAIMTAHDTQHATPFVDIGGRHVIVGATYDPRLIVGHTQPQIAAALHDPHSALGAGIISAANIITASICESTGGRPAAVCTSSGVSAAAKVLP